jgi:hypothetical protein
MDHDRKVCPRCGEPTAGYGFCAPCRAHIDSLTGGPASREDLTTSQVLREVVRLEEALADASKGMSDRGLVGSSTAAVEVDPAPEPVADEPVSGSQEIAKLPVSGTDAAPRSEVARLEDVLTVVPRSEAPAIPPRTAAAADPAPEKLTSVPPPEPVVKAEVTSVPPPEPTAPAAIQPTSPNYVAAHMLRAAFWFEQTSAFESRPDNEVEPEPVLPELDPNRHVATSVPPPEPTPQAEPLPPAAIETPQRNWITMLCLLALVALVVVLSGRRPCRCDCHKTH